MISRIIQFRDRITQSRAYFAVFKLPVIVFTALFGFILEFIIELPFMVLCMLDRDGQSHRRERTETRGQGQNSRGRIAEDRRQRIRTSEIGSQTIKKITKTRNL